MKKNALLLVSWAIAIAAMGVVWLRGGEPASAPPAPAAPVAEPLVVGPIRPIPQAIDLDERKVALGGRLFHDTRLSADGKVSCATCHDLDKGGADGRRVSAGIHGREGELNAPTVFNSVFNFRQYWDGRARDLEEQVEGPLTHPNEMGSNWEHVMAVLRGDPEYVRQFEAIYGEIARKPVENAIAEFEKSLITPDSDFDRYLRGDEDAISEDVRRGFTRFVECGCATCHQGINVGGNMFQTFGRMKDYFGSKETLTKGDMGRFNVTGREADKHRFKVPTLRNIALTAPYLHDGSVETLEEAVQLMAEYELGTRLSEEDVRLIVLFLESLTGRMPR